MCWKAVHSLAVGTVRKSRHSTLLKLLFTLVVVISTIVYVTVWSNFALNLNTVVVEIPFGRDDVSNRSNVSAIVLTTTNAGFLDLTENMLESIRRTGSRPNITVIAEDEKSFQTLSMRAKTQPGLRVQKTNSGVTTSDKLMVNTAIYNRLVNKRPSYLLSLLEKGNHVLFVDVDTYWFHDPLKNLKWDFDFALHNEFTPPTYGFCDGFVFYRPTENTIRFVKEWVYLLATTDKETPDQTVMNRLILSKKFPLKIGVLLASQFPDGFKYFKTKGWRNKNNNTIAVHLSYLYGHQEKLEHLKNQSLWLL
ncbi:UDP-D-xylose:L-fucose alpha-1,3-D-xylosyltransferase 3-like [Asterias rubens]|uniref:UDP-D-xylose:L-fucose alpha-1,3-D-xylosyltransferase 3-like n=1 Tax=Asterias rubens TaxID=7604 RepID=UPI001455B6B5|nr:UDP-D-xylose:L-fucose alpha-1,3-D-xylosyltransferase 3-like [Asterias rubens]